jgi:hypothetical protein
MGADALPASCHHRTGIAMMLSSVLRSGTNDIRGQQASGRPRERAVERKTARTIGLLTTCPTGSSSGTPWRPGNNLVRAGNAAPSGTRVGRSSPPARRGSPMEHAHRLPLVQSPVGEARLLFAARELISLSHEPPGALEAVGVGRSPRSDTRSATLFFAATGGITIGDVGFGGARHRPLGTAVHSASEAH